MALVIRAELALLKAAATPQRRGLLAPVASISQHLHGPHLGKDERDQPGRSCSSALAAPCQYRSPWMVRSLGAMMPPHGQRAVHTSAAISILTTGAVGAAPAVTLAFTPAAALLGGVVLGIAVSGKLLLTGRILGISGAIKGFVNNDAAAWRVAFLMGMAAGGLILTGVMPSAFEPLPATFPVTRAALAGALVGFGASMGNGCTSGHGVCGIARMSPRSLAYTATFMGSGMAAATLARTAEALGVSAAAPPHLQALLPAEAQIAAATAAAGVLAFVVLAGAARLAHGGSSGAQQQQQQVPSRLLRGLDVASEAVAGLLFALGLGLSGMMHPSKVAGFLSVTSPAWDASLAFVMGGAVAVAALAFAAVQRAKLLPRPLAAAAFCIPTSTVVDTRLLLGGVMFGAGWGLAGLCPGPALVAAVGATSAHLPAFLASLVAGMWLEARLGGRLLAALPAMAPTKPSSTATSSK